MPVSSSSSGAPRPSFAARAGTHKLPEFEVMDQAHRAVMAMLASFAALVSRLNDQGLDEPARESAREILAFFNGPGRTHHADEETHVFPGLLACSNEQLVADVKRLQQDHGWLEEDWDELRPHVLAIADGYNGYDLPLLTAALPIFHALYLEHITLEETRVYPAAKRQKLALLEGRSGQPVEI
jgi:hemerythrin-like domain-containing protein